MDVNLAADLMDIRVRICAGEDVSDEEMRAIILDLRKDRRSAATSTTKARSAKAGPKQVDMDKLFGIQGEVLR